MAASMFVLLFTAFLPIVGVQFAWVHVALDGRAGADRLDPLPHRPRDVLPRLLVDLGRARRTSPSSRPRLLRELGQDVPGPKSGKYPLGNRLYHLAMVVAGLGAVVTGVLMMWRVRTPFFTRNPYLLSDSTWGVTYVATGWPASALVGLVIAHVTSRCGPRSCGSPSR